MKKALTIILMFIMSITLTLAEDSNASSEADVGFISETGLKPGESLETVLEALADKG